MEHGMVWNTKQAEGVQEAFDIRELLQYMDQVDNDTIKNFIPYRLCFLQRASIPRTTSYLHQRGS